MPPVDLSYATPPDRLIEEKARAYLMHTRNVRIDSTPDDVDIDWVVYLRGEFWGLAAFSIEEASFKSRESKTEGVALCRKKYDRMVLSQHRLFRKEGRCHLFFFVLALDGFYSADLGVSVNELPDIEVKGDNLWIATRYFKRLDTGAHYTFTLRQLQPKQEEPTEKEKAAAEQRTMELIKEAKKGLDSGAAKAQEDEHHTKA